jgi:hypothetical protein
MLLHVAFFGIFVGFVQVHRSAVNCMNIPTVTLQSLLVGAMTTLRAERPNNRHSIPGKVTRFFFFFPSPQVSDRHRLTQPQIQCTPGALSTESKTAGA